jgi:hypothetical protein
MARWNARLLLGNTFDFTSLSNFFNVAWSTDIAIFAVAISTTSGITIGHTE